MSHSKNDIEVRSQDGEWQMAILFRDGTAIFSARAWESGHPVGLAACTLAVKLGAKIVGDDGEYYPLVPGSQAFTS